ncbi:hypothetical protein G4G29_00495 [Microbacterium sp. Se63.02b]|nr:hypothetical protein G4G29_00495 [Microbacterium sp. Se63.02b]
MTLDGGAGRRPARPRSVPAHLHSAGESWSEGVDSPEIYAQAPIPFHVLLNVGDAHPEGIDRFVRAAAEARTDVALRDGWNGR